MICSSALTPAPSHRKRAEVKSLRHPHTSLRFCSAATCAKVSPTDDLRVNEARHVPPPAPGNVPTRVRRAFSRLADADACSLRGRRRRARRRHDHGSRPEPRADAARDSRHAIGSRGGHLAVRTPGLATGRRTDRFTAQCRTQDDRATRHRHPCRRLHQREERLHVRSLADDLASPSRRHAARCR